MAAGENDPGAVLDRLAEAGITHVLVLGRAAGLTAAAAGRPPAVIPCDPADPDGPAAALAGLYAAAVDLDGTAVCGGRLAVAGLPTLPWRGERHWVPAAARRRTEPAAARGALYGPAWHPVALHGAAGLPEPVLVIHGGEPAALDLMAALRRAGRSCRELSRGGGDDVRAALAGLPAGSVVLLPGEPAEAGVVLVAAAVQGLLANGGQARLHVVTAGAFPQTAGGEGRPDGGAIWGMVRSVFMERPELAGRLVDVAPEVDGERLLRALVPAPGQGTEAQLVLTAKEALAPRLVRLGGEAGSPYAARPDRTYLVTGGLGSLGLRLADWLVERGARHLLLAGRRGLSGQATLAALLEDDRAGPVAARLLAWRERGAAVRVAAADVADEAQMRQVLSLCGDALPPPGGVVHAAGVSASLPVTALDRPTLDRVLRAKVTGAKLLDRLTRDGDLDLFLLCSSAAAWGGPFLAAYAAGNACLDHLALHRSAGGLPALSVQWGGWLGSTMLDAETRAYQEKLGFRALEPERMLALLDRLLALHVPLAAVLDVDWDGYRSLARPAGLAGFVAEVAPAAGAEQPDSAFRRRVLAAHPRRRPALLFEAAARHAARQLGHADPAALPPDEPLQALGFNSLVAVEFRNALAAELGMALSATLVFEHPTLRAVAAYLAGLLAEDEGPPAAAAEPPARPEEDVPARPELEAVTLDDMHALLVRKLEGA